MNYFQKKKLAFMSIVNRVKGFIRTITGALPLTLEGCVDEESIIDYTLYGQSVQNGTPTPEMPVEVESVGEYDETTGKYKIPIKVSGKNLFDIDDDFVNKCFNGRDGYSHYKMQLKPNTTYAVSVTENNQNNYIVISNGGEYNATGIQQIWLSHKTNSSLTLKPNKTQKVTTTDNGLIYLCVTTGYDVKLYKTQLIKCISGLQIEEGATATDYEPYHKPITTNIYLDEPLRKVGDYADYIDFENGKVVRNVEKYTFTGKETDQGGATNDPDSFGYVVKLSSLSLSNKKAGLCNCLRQGVVASSGTNRFAYHNIANHPFVYVFFKKTDFPELGTYSPSTAKQVVKEMYDSGVPMVLYYNRNTPTETSITLPNLPTFKGTSIISADTTIQPSNAEIEYYSNVKE